MSANKINSPEIFCRRHFSFCGTFEQGLHTGSHSGQCADRVVSAQRCGTLAVAPKGALRDSIFRLVPSTGNNAQTLSTICVDKVVHSLQKKNLSGLRKRLFCRCPQFDPTFLCLLNKALRNLQTGAVCPIDEQSVQGLAVDSVISRHAFRARFDAGFQPPPCGAP